MNREEALRRVKGYLTDYLPIEDSGELDEIMEALEQEPTLDKIRAEVPKLGLGIIGQNLVLELIDKYRKEN